MNKTRQDPGHIACRKHSRPDYHLHMIAGPKKCRRQSDPALVAEVDTSAACSCAACCVRYLKWLFHAFKVIQGPMAYPFQFHGNFKPRDCKTTQLAIYSLTFKSLNK